MILTLMDTHTHTHTHTRCYFLIYPFSRKEVSGTTTAHMSPDGLVEEEFHSFLNSGTRLEVRGLE